MAETRSCTVLWLTLLLSAIPVLAVEDLQTLDEFRDDVVRSHNLKRSLHGCPPLHVNSTLQEYAQNWANHLAAIDNFKISDGDYGENVYYSDDPIDGRYTVDIWYSKSKYYDYSNPVYSQRTAPFTQLIWKSTTDIGVGVAKNYEGVNTYVVASYYPKGNNFDEFAENVPRPL